MAEGPTRFVKPYSRLTDDQVPLQAAGHHDRCGRRVRGKRHIQAPVELDEPSGASSQGYARRADLARSPRRGPRSGVLCSGS